LSKDLYVLHDELVELPDDLTAPLLPEHDNENTLNYLEFGAYTRAKEAFENETQATSYIYLILYNRLWRHRRNEDGTFKYFRDGKFLQELYLPDLERVVRWGRASIFAKFRAMKLAVNGLHLLPEQIEAYGGIGVFEAVEDEVSRNGKINSKTGKIIEFNKDTNGLSAEEFIINIVKSFSPDNADEMRPSEIRDALRNNLSNRPNIWFELIVITRGYDKTGYETRWCREEVTGGILDHQNGLISEGKIPVDVLAEYCRRLRVKNPLKVDGESGPTREKHDDVVVEQKGFSEGDQESSV
jgi:hypothetical protein